MSRNSTHHSQSHSHSYTEASIHSFDPLEAITADEHSEDEVESEQQQQQQELDEPISPHYQSLSHSQTHSHTQSHSHSPLQLHRSVIPLAVQRAARARLMTASQSPALQGKDASMIDSQLADQDDGASMPGDSSGASVASSSASAKTLAKKEAKRRKRAAEKAKAAADNEPEQFVPDLPAPAPVAAPAAPQAQQQHQQRSVELSTSSVNSISSTATPAVPIVASAAVPAINTAAAVASSGVHPSFVSAIEPDSPTHASVSQIPTRHRMSSASSAMMQSSVGGSPVQSSSNAAQQSQSQSQSRSYSPLLTSGSGGGINSAQALAALHLGTVRAAAAAPSDDAIAQMDLPFSVTVTSPVLAGESLIDQHITYKVHSTITLPMKTPATSAASSLNSTANHRTQAQTHSPSASTSLNAFSTRSLQSLVIRRYSDFVWLHSALSHNPLFFGYLIPHLPEKQSIISMDRLSKSIQHTTNSLTSGTTSAAAAQQQAATAHSAAHTTGLITERRSHSPTAASSSAELYNDEFIEERRVGLAKFLHRLLSHPALRLSDELIVFLSGSASAFADAKHGRITVSESAQRRHAPQHAVQAATSTSASSLVVNFLKDSFQSITQSIANTSVVQSVTHSPTFAATQHALYSAAPKTADDDYCEQTLARMVSTEAACRELHQQLHALLQQAPAKLSRTMQSTQVAALQLAKAASSGSPTHSSNANSSGSGGSSEQELTSVTSSSATGAISLCMSQLADVCKQVDNQAYESTELLQLSKSALASLNDAARLCSSVRNSCLASRHKLLNAYLHAKQLRDDASSSAASKDKSSIASSAAALQAAAAGSASPTALSLLSPHSATVTRPASASAYVNQSRTSDSGTTLSSGGQVAASNSDLSNSASASASPNPLHAAVALASPISRNSSTGSPVPQSLPHPPIHSTSFLCISLADAESNLSQRLSELSDCTRRVRRSVAQADEELQSVIESCVRSTTLHQERQLAAALKQWRPTAS